MTTAQIYRDPVGIGAIEFTEPFVEGLAKEKALPVVTDLLADRLHDTSDKRVKRCAYCGYLFRDTTRPNNAKTCGKPCKVALDTLNRAKKNADKALLKPKKQEKRFAEYTYWMEYPYWINEYEMLKRSWKHEVPYAPDKLAQIAAAKQRDALNGGKRKKPEIIPYSGDEDEVQSRVFVRFSSRVDRKPSEVKVKKMSREDIEQHYVNSYSEAHLKAERKRASLAAVKRYKG